MAQAANIVLADALATPVNHTFIPEAVDANGVFWFVDQSQSNPVGYWRISIELKRPPAIKPGVSSKDRNYRIRIMLHEPVLETISNSTVSGILPAPVVAFVPKVDMEFVMSERTPLQNRKDLRKMAAALLNDTQVINAVELLQGIW